MERGAWRAALGGISKSWTRLSDYAQHTWGGKELPEAEDTRGYIRVDERESPTQDCKAIVLPFNINKLTKRRISLPMRGTWVWSLVQEDPTSCGAAKPVHATATACGL